MHGLRAYSFRAGIVVLAAAGALVPLPGKAVDRWYADGLYAWLQPLLTSLSNLAPFALFDLLVAVVGVIFLVFAVRDLRRSGARMRGAVRILARTIVWSAAWYLVFLACWGLNYRRPRLRDSHAYDASAVTATAAAAASRLAVTRLNALFAPAHAAGFPEAGAIDPALAAGFARALHDVGIAREVVPARPKHTALDWYFRRAGVDGMTDPYFLETLIAGGVLPAERSFVVAHEWSHLAGITDEGEANFAGWLACLRASPSGEYSGWLFLYSELARAVSRADRAAMTEALAAGPRRDLRAIRERYAREVSPRIADAGWRVYDSYLKANRVEAGAASYDEVVRLVLGLRVDGRPVLAGAP
jgi:Protein of unknown function (DUF3810)